MYPDFKEKVDPITLFSVLRQAIPDLFTTAETLPSSLSSLISVPPAWRSLLLSMPICTFQLSVIRVFAKLVHFFTWGLVVYWGWTGFNNITGQLTLCMTFICLLMP